MARLIDDVRAARAVDTPWWIPNRLAYKWNAHAREVLNYVRTLELPVLLIDNVADYYYRGTDQEFWDLGRDFPNLAPPYPVFWTEHKMPHTIHSKEYGTSDVSNCLGSKARMGLFWVASEKWDGEGVPDNVKWILTAELFIDYDCRGKLIEGPTGTWILMIDKDGALVGQPQMQCFSGGQFEDVLQGFMTWLHPALLATSFLHCRNVKVIDNEVPKPLAKKYQARTGIWPTPYHTLEIEPLKQILRTQGGATPGGNGLAKAMHICRGHFKDYREGRGLFGKYHQLVWQPSVVRGTKGDKPAPREMEIKL